VTLNIDPQAFTDLIAKARSDEDFKADLLRNPKETLAAFGIEADTDIEVVQNTSDKVYLVLPADIAFPSPSDEEVEATVGPVGRSVCSQSYSCCCEKHAMVEGDPLV